MQLFLLSLALLAGVSRAVVDITANDVTVSCGIEDTTLGFGPIVVTVRYTPDSWDRSTGSNATIYPEGYESVVNATVACRETIDTAVSPWNYTLEVDSANLTIGETGPCGQMRTDAETVQFDLVVREGRIANGDDMYFTIKCLYRASNVGGLGSVIVGGAPDNSIDVVVTATPNTLDRTYELQLMYGDGDAKDTVTRGQVLIGTNVYLRALMSGPDLGTVPPAVAGDENSMRVLNCVACRKQSQQCVTIFQNYCPVLGVGAAFQSDSGFVTHASGGLTKSGLFKMFNFGGLSSVEFTCEIEVCRIATQCSGQNCPTTSSTRKRRALMKRQATDSLAGTKYLTVEVDVVTERTNNDDTTGSNAGNTNTIMYIVLGIVGALVLLCLIAGLIFFMRMRNKDGNEKTVIQHHHNSPYVNGGYKA